MKPIAIRAIPAAAMILISPLPQAWAQVYNRPTYSSPIAISRNDKLIWTVNPGDDSVSVFRPDNNTRITKITVGDEPQSVALTPDGQYAYVANAAAGTVSVILIDDPAWGTFSATLITHLVTGAEPWNVVTSPDGLRVFVANSGQDTITVINASTRTILGHVDLRNSIVQRGNWGYLPNIGASPSRPLRFNLDTHALVSQIGAVNSASPTDLGALNLPLGARDPEPGKVRHFFANPWALAFTTQSGAGSAYVVSAGSDLLVKLNVAADDSLSFTMDGDTTRCIDLNDPDNPLTSGVNAGKNPQGIAINSTGTRAYVANFISRNVSVVDLASDSVVAVVSSS